MENKLSGKHCVVFTLRHSITNLGSKNIVVQVLTSLVRFTVNVDFKFDESPIATHIS